MPAVRDPHRRVGQPGVEVRSVHFGDHARVRSALTTLAPVLPADERSLEIKTEVLSRMSRQQEALDTARQQVALDPTDLQGQMARLGLLIKTGTPPKDVARERFRMQ